MRFKILFVVVIGGVISASAQQGVKTADWRSHCGDGASTRYSAPDQIMINGRQYIVFTAGDAAGMPAQLVAYALPVEKK